jgi:hypothetical protein
MDKFLDAYDPPKLNQHDINHLNRSIKSNKIESLLENPGFNSFAEFQHTFKENINSICVPKIIP